MITIASVRHRHVEVSRLIRACWMTGSDGCLKHRKPENTKSPVPDSSPRKTSLWIFEKRINGSLLVGLLEITFSKAKLVPFKPVELIQPTLSVLLAHCCWGNLLGRHSPFCSAHNTLPFPRCALIRVQKTVKKWNEKVKRWEGSYFGKCNCLFIGAL